jgi:hypothetical protein
MDSLMNPHEQAFVEAFIHSDRRERFLAALANPKKRTIFNRELHHPKSSFLLSKYIERIVPSQHHTRFLAPKLRSMGATDECWVFGNHIDGQQMKLEDALDELIGYGTGTIVSCLPGRLAFFESEDERVILHKP